MDSIIKYTLYVIFLVSFITGANILFGGSIAVPGATITAQVQIDNELRFFAMFWMAYGVFCFWVAKNLVERHHFIPFIALVFFLGGVGRLLSVLMAGNPGEFLLGAMALEFILPMVIYGVYKKQSNTEFSSITR